MRRRLPVLAILGPSGSGKSTLADLLIERGLPGLDFRRIITTTDRARRPDEVDGTSYYFVDTSRFLAMVESGEFVEFAEVYGQLKGVTKAELQRIAATGAVPIAVVDFQGLTTLRAALGDQAVYAVYLLLDDTAETERRIRGRDRQIPEDEVLRRVVRAHQWNERATTSQEIDHVHHCIPGVEENFQALVEGLQNSIYLRDRPTRAIL